MSEHPTYQDKKEKAQKIGYEVHDRQNTKWAKEIGGKCSHKWQPLSFIFETQLLDEHGRVVIRQPDVANGRVYCVCMECCSHTYINTGYVGYYLNSPDLLEIEEEEEAADGGD